MGRLLILGGVVLAVVIFGFSLISVSGGSSDVNASAVLANLGSDTSGFTRAIGRATGSSRRISARTPISRPSGGTTPATSRPTTGGASATSSRSSAARLRRPKPTPPRSGAPTSFTWRISPSATWRATSSITTSASAGPARGWRARRSTRSIASGWTNWQVRRERRRYANAHQRGDRSGGGRSGARPDQAARPARRSRLERQERRAGQRQLLLFADAPAHQRHDHDRRRTSPSAARPGWITNSARARSARMRTAGIGSACSWTTIAS